jgi:TPR repeat protein
MKTSISLLALIHMMVFVEQPAWSMEGQNEQNEQNEQGRKAGAKREFKEISTNPIPENLISSVQRQRFKPLDKMFFPSYSGEPVSYLSMIEEVAGPFPSAKMELGLDYLTGKGISPDPEKAISLLSEVAEKGDLGAKTILGIHYCMGRDSIPQDFNKARDFFEDAVKQDHPMAQYHLGWMYQHGNGVPQDMNKAIKFFKQAAKKGYLGAKLKLGIIYSLGKGDIPRDMNKAVKYLKQVADQGAREAQFKLGIIYLAGKGDIPQDFNKARDFFEDAAKQGHPKAQYCLGQMYQHGNGVLKDMNKAIEYYERSADQGYQLAQDILKRYSAKRQKTDTSTYKMAISNLLN